MARKRMLHPAFFRSSTVAKLSYRARITFAGLWIYADDEGRGLDDVRLIKSEIWPQDDDVSLDAIEDDLASIQALKLIRRYKKHGQKCLVVTSWHEHQRISHPTESKLPPPPARSGKSPETLRRSSAKPSPNAVEVKSRREVVEVKGPSASDNSGSQATTWRPDRHMSDEARLLAQRFSDAKGNSQDVHEVTEVLKAEGCLIAGEIAGRTGKSARHVHLVCASNPEVFVQHADSLAWDLVASPTSNLKAVGAG